MINQYTPDTLEVSSVAIHTDRIFDFGGIPQIYADCLTRGDLISHLGEHLQVYSEPKYTQQGIVFKVLHLNSKDDPYQVCFDPNWRFDYVNIQEAA